jgi:aspartyl-tRNA synthetase
MLRSHTCGQLNISNIGQKVVLTAWVNSIRNHGGVIFIDLRDHYGLTQVKFDLRNNSQELQKVEKIHNEWVLKVEGQVQARPETMINKKMKTGEIEIIADDLEILSECKTLPFEINEKKVALANESLRLKYRFIDLRRPKLQKMLEVKDEFFSYLRQYFHKQGFMEIQTPILANSSPEGARDFLVPSRLYPGKFYALPQAPQQFKQLLMIGGLDKYFQIAPCFRDEDPRLDRHYGEFYQLDMEMSFVEQKDIMKVIEPVMKESTTKFSQKKLINLEPDGSFKKISWKRKYSNK